MPCFARLIRLACLVFVPTTTSNMNPTVIKNANVFLLGLAFMLMFTAFQTMGNIQTTILNSARNPNSTGYVPGFDGVGYTSLAIIYGVFSASNWIAPSVVAVLGPRLTMFVGGLTYASFIAQFFQPNTYALYFLSALLGVGAAIIWTGQGNFLSLNSDDRTMSRNSGIFWAMLQCSMVIGNTFVFFEFQGLTDIDKHTRTVVVIVLLSVCCVGVLTLVLLRPVPQMEEEELLAGGSQASETPMQALKGAWKLFITPDMLLLSVLFFYTGLELTFWSGVYGPSIGSTLAFGVAAKSLVGMHGIFVGVGESLGGLVFGIFGSQLVKRGRDPVVMLGFVIHAAAAFGVFLNLPNSAPLGDTNDVGFIHANQYLAIVCSFLFGFGDACFNTQIFSILGSVYKERSSAGFAIFKFAQSFAAAVAFFYSQAVPLYYQLGILVVFNVLGTMSFLRVELKLASRQNNVTVGDGGDNSVLEADNQSDRVSVHSDDRLLEN